MKQEPIKEDGPVAAPANMTGGIEGPKLPIKPANVFKRVLALKKKKKNPADRDSHKFI